MRRQWNLLLVMITILVVLVGCGASMHTSSTKTGAHMSPLPTRLRVTRPATSGYATFFERTIKNTLAVQQLYQATGKLPIAPSGVINCPVDNGVVYQLDFLQGSVVLQHMTLQSTSCQFLFVKAGLRDAHLTNSAFRSLFTQVVGIPSLNPVLRKTTA